MHQYAHYSYFSWTDFNFEQYLASRPVLHHTADVHSVTLLDLGWEPIEVMQHCSDLKPMWQAPRWQKWVLSP